jgi:hypothetical protein
MTTYEMAKELKKMLEVGLRDRAIAMATSLVEALEPKGAAVANDPAALAQSTRGAGGRFKRGT